MDAVDVDERIRRLLESGDHASVRELLVEHFDAKVSALCRGMVGNPVTAEDLKQDTFERAFEGLASFRGESSASTWLLRIARNRCIDHLRGSETRRVAPSGDAAADVPDESGRSIAEVVASLQRAENALTILDPEDRALVLLHHVHDVSYAELAETFGVREGALRMRMARALAQMRAALEREDALDASVGVRRRRRGIQVPRSALWIALASMLGAFGALWYGVITPQKEAAAALEAQLADLQREQAEAEQALAAAQQHGASEEDLQRLRDQLAQAQQAATSGAAPNPDLVASTTSMRVHRTVESYPTSTMSTYGGCMGALCGLMRTSDGMSSTTPRDAGVRPLDAGVRVRDAGH